MLWTNAEDGRIPQERATNTSQTNEHSKKNSILIENNNNNNSVTNGHAKSANERYEKRIVGLVDGFFRPTDELFPTK